MFVTRPAESNLQAAPANIFANETAAQQARHREIDSEYRRRKRGNRNSVKKNVRICELERFFTDRFGAVLPDDDSGIDDIFVMANHLACLDAAEQRITAWVRLRAPWYGASDTAALLETVLLKPLKWTADKLADRLGINHATQTRLALTTIGATDFRKADRRKRRRKRNNEKKQARRIEAGAAPHALSAERTQCWLELGMSRRTYFRRRKNGTLGTGGTNSGTAYLNLSDVPDSVPRRAAAHGGSWARAVSSAA